MKIPVPQVRELCAHVLQLCDYVTNASSHTDLGTVTGKARQVQQMIGLMYGDEPVRGGVDSDTQFSTEDRPVRYSGSKPSGSAPAGAIPAPSPSDDDDIGDLL